MFDHRDSFVDPAVRSRLQRMRRGMLDYILDETDLVRMMSL